MQDVVVYKINPALDKAVRLKLKSIRDYNAAMLNGSIPVEMGTRLSDEDIKSIEGLLTELGNPESKGDPLIDHIQRANAHRARNQMEVAAGVGEDGQPAGEN